MKTKLSILGLAVVSMTLFSFAPKKNKVFNLTTDGNYRVDADNMSDADIKYLLDNTQTYSGARIFKETILFNKSADDGKVKETIALHESGTNTNGDDDTVDPGEGLRRIVAKYNK